MAMAGEGYTQFAPLSGEISFDIDISKVPAGMPGPQTHATLHMH